MACTNPLIPALGLLLIARRREQLRRRRAVIVAAATWWYENQEQYRDSEGSEEEYFEESDPFDIQAGPHVHDDTLPPEQRHLQKQQEFE
jgi:hypothetical protein